MNKVLSIIFVDNGTRIERAVRWLGLVIDDAAERAFGALHNGELGTAPFDLAPIPSRSDLAAEQTTPFGGFSRHS